MIKNIKFTRTLLLTFFGMIFAHTAFAVPLLISISNPPAAVTVNTVGGTQFWPNAGTLNGGAPISLRATVTSLSAGDTVSLFTSGDNPVVRANTGSLAATILWEVFDTATGLPIVGDPDFLITDIDGSGGNPIESVSAACAGLTSYTTNGAYIAGCNANNDPNPPNACQSNIRVSESGGSILGEGTQGQNGGQQEGYMQYSWTDVSSWEVSYFATSGGRWYVHDADGDIPFDGTRVDVNLVDLATIKGLTAGSLTSPAQNESITFQIDLSNAGPSPATAANLIDLLPAGLSYQSHTTTAGIYNVGNGSWTGVNVAVGGVETLTITALVTASAGTTITNVTTTALAQESVCSSRDFLQYSFVVAETPAPELEIEKTVDPVTSFSKAGDTITYRYLISNTGNINIDNVMPIDGGPSFGAQPAINMLSPFTPLTATITPGNSQIFTATYLLDQDDVDNMAQDPNPLTGIDNSATASGDPAGGVALPTVVASMVETGFAPMPSLTVAKSVSAATTFSQAGDTITYEYLVTNTGNITIDVVTPTDAGPTFNGLPAVNALSAFNIAPVSLAPQAMQTFTATYVLAQLDVDNMAGAGDPLTAIDNTASASGDPIGVSALPAVPEDMAETGFAPMPFLTIDKSVSSATTFSKAGDTITYQYVVNNTGNVTINNVVPTDSGPTFDSMPAVNLLSPFTPTSTTIAPMGMATFTASYLLDQADVDKMFAAADPATAIDNGASAIGTPTGGTLPAVLLDTVETGFVVAAQLSLAKTAGAPSVGLGANAAATDAGDTIAYAFAVTNNGGVSISNVIVNDLGVTFNSMPGTGSLSAISCPITNLAPLQTTTCTALYTLSQLDVDNAIVGGAGSVVNSANVSGQDPAAGSVTSPTVMATTAIAADSSINISKTATAPTITGGPDASIVDPGDTISYTIVVENTGNTTLSAVTISDTIVAVTCPVTTALGNPFANDGSDILAVADSISCGAVYSLLQSDLDNGGVENTASVSSVDPTGANTSDDDTVNSGFTQKTSISLVKSGSTLPANPMEGDLITYSFELTNTGNVTLSDAQVSDVNCEIPVSPLTFASGYVSGDANTPGVMEAGETWMFSCQYAIIPGDINLGEIANTATGTGTPPASSMLPAPTSMASNLIEAQQNAAISLDKTASLASVMGGSLLSATDVGDTISYSFVVENTGNVTLDNVVVTDPLITDAPNNGTISCGAGIASMAAGAQVTCMATYTLTLADINAGMTGNTAMATGTPPISVPPADAPVAQSSAVVNITALPELSVVKTADALPSPFMQGSTITYNFVILNSGNVTINSVAPLDMGPSFNGIAGTNALSAFSPISANLDPGIDQAFTATYIVSQSDVDNLSTATVPLTAIGNQATAQGAPVIGSLPPVDPSGVETGVELTPSIELIKTSVAPNPALVGSDITYTFTLANTGAVSLSNPTVSDAKCVVPGSLLSFTSGYASGDVGATAGVLEPNETWTFSCTYPLQQADIDAGNVENTAVGAGQTPSGDAIEDTSDTNNPGDGGAADNDPTNTPLVQTPSWNVVKSTNSVPTMAGETLLYQFVIDNTGNVSISGVMLNDSKCAAVPVLVSGDLIADMILDPSEIWTFECTSVPVTQDEVNAATVDNTVTVTGTPPPGSPPLVPDTVTVMTPIAPAPALSVAKSASPATVGLGALAAATDAGDTIAYSFIVENTGNVTLTSIVVNDAGPSFGALPLAGIWPGVTCPITTLLPAQTTTCSATYTLVQADVDAAIAAGANSVTNSATASGMPPTGPVLSSDPSPTALSIEAMPELQIVKTAGTPSTMMGSDPMLSDSNGDTVLFNITVENTGNTTLSNVNITDDLTTVSCPGPAQPSGLPFVNGAGSLAVGDTISCTATYFIQQGDIDSGQVVNTATVASQDPSGTAVDGVAEAISSFTQKTSVALLKTSTQLSTMPPPQAGDLITYTFALTNAGNVTLTDAQIDDAQCQFPVGPLTQVNGLDVASDTGADGLLSAGETWDFNCDYAITVADILLGEITNTATGTGTPPATSGLDAPSATSSALVAAQQSAAITLDKVAGMPTVLAGVLNDASDIGDAGNPGDTITFSFNIANTGNIPFVTVSLSDPLITNAPNSSVFTCELNSLIPVPFALDLDPLPAGEDITCTGVYDITQVDIDGGGVANNATVMGNTPGNIPPAPEASSGSIVPIAPDPKMSIEKTASVIPANVAAGTIITYSYAVQNTGNVSLSVVSPVDLGPTFNGVVGTNSLSAFSPAPSSLLPGESQIFTATYEISQVDLDNMAASATPATAIVNEATAEAEPANGPAPVVEPDTVETGVAPNPLIELIKTSSVPSMVFAGSLISYTFELRNAGNVTISNPLVNDSKCQIPAGPLSFTNGYISGDTGTIAQSLDVGETWTFSCDYAITQADIDAGTVQNTADAVGQDPAGMNAVDDSDSGNPADENGTDMDPTNTPLVRNPSLDVSKSTNSMPTSLGDTLVYEFLITNTGNVSISGVTVTDAKCQPLTILLDGSTDLLGDLIVSPAGALGSPPAEQWLYTCTSLPLIQADLDAGAIVNQVTVMGTAPGGNPEDATDTITTDIDATPAMSLVKSAGTTSLNADGTFDQVFNFALKNTGNVTLNTVAINDNIPTQFGVCFDSILSTGTISQMDIAPAADSAIASIGVAPVIATVATLAVGDSVLVDNYIVRFNPNAAGCAFPMPAQNSATANADTMAAGPITDVSDNGSDPDAAGPNDLGVPTPFMPPLYMPQLGSSKQAGTPSLNADGSFDVQYTILLQNTGNVDLQNLTVFDDLAGQFGSAFTASPASDPSGGVIVAPSVSEVNDANTDNLVTPLQSIAFDGSAASNMLDGLSGYLGVGDRIQITFSVRIDPNAPAAPVAFMNTATVGGVDPSGETTNDDTDAGSDPEANPGGPGTPTPVLPPVYSPSIELTKIGTINSNGTIDYQFTVVNDGDVNVENIALTDILITSFVYAAADDADNDSDIDLLVPGAMAIVTASYTLTVVDIAAGMVENTAIASGTDPSGGPVEDDSDSGNPADDTGADDDPTVTPLNPPSLGVAKALKAGSPVDLGNGTYQVSYQFVVENTGIFDLFDLQLTDDLNAMINNPNVNGATFSNPVVISPNNTLTPSLSYDGASDINLLRGTDPLLAGEVGLVELSFTFSPDVYFGPFLNQAAVMANDANGDPVQDLSEQGTMVNPDSDSFTPFDIATPSTPITLGWFRAESQGGLVMFNWVTEIEVSNAGFYLAVEQESGAWRRINQQMIAAKGDSTHVQEYQYLESGIDGTRFKLVDVSVTGKLVEHGPFELNLDYGMRAERRSTDWQKYKSESDLKRAQREKEIQQEMQDRLRQLKGNTSRGPNQKSLGLWGRIASLMLSALIPVAEAADLASFTVQESGLYRVSHQELLNKGIDLQGVAINRIGLEQANLPWPLKVYPSGSNVFSASSSIVFPAQGLVTLYTGANKYTLVLDKSEPSLIQDDFTPVPENTAPAQSYLAEKTYAPQNRYTHLSPSEDDSWYADRLQAISSPASKSIQLAIDDYAPALNTGSSRSGSIARMPNLRPRLEVNLWGNSNLPGNGLTKPDHHVLVDFNGEVVADERFDGLHEFKIEKVLSTLNHGQNAVTVTLPKDHGYQFDLVNVDRISIHYPRLFKAEQAGTSLEFESDWSFFKLAELADEEVTIVRLDEDRKAYLMTERASGYCTQGCVYFTGSSANEKNAYFVATNSGFKSPQIDVLSAAQDNFSGEAKFLIISHPDFIQTASNALEVYASELAAKYGSADIVNVEDIYGEYSGHVMDANAIYSYVQDSYHERATRHVLMVGGDIYDYHNNLNGGARSFIPSLYVRIATNVNAVPSDAKYADVDDDQIPDITISRLPVRSSAELDTMLAKRTAYLARSAPNSAVFAADKQDGSGYSFKSDSNHNISNHFSGWDITTVYMDDTTIENGKQQLLNSIDAGANLTSYFGHSSTDRWSVSGLLTGQDVAGLTNHSDPTVVAQWGCWNTFYVSPDQDSLAHRFLVDGSHGAVTVMGASSFTKADAEQKMADLLYARLNQGMDIGAAVLSAKRALAEDSPHQLDVLLGWAVLGTDDFSVIGQ